MDFLYHYALPRFNGKIYFDPHVFQAGMYRYTFICFHRYAYLLCCSRQWSSCVWTEVLAHGQEPGMGVFCVFLLLDEDRLQASWGIVMLCFAQFTQLAYEIEVV